ncbi:hypothetical protein ACU4GD_39595 [Cupriavidus basilensis]
MKLLSGRRDCPAPRTRSHRTGDMGLWQGREGGRRRPGSCQPYATTCRWRGWRSRRGGALAELDRPDHRRRFGVTRFVLPGLAGPPRTKAVVHYEAVRDSGELIVGNANVKR